MWPFGEREPEAPPALPSTVGEALKLWNHPDRAALALSFIPDHLSEQQRIQRLETFRQSNQVNWPVIQQGFRQSDQAAADLYASPHIRQMMETEGLEGVQRRYPSIPPPPLSRLSDTPEVGPPAPKRYDLPPIDYPTLGQTLERERQIDELIGRARAGQGNYDAYRKGQDAIAQALGTGSVQDYLDTGNPAYLQRLRGTPDASGGADTPSAPAPAFAREPEGREDRADRRAREKAAAERQAKIEADIQEGDAFVDTILSSLTKVATDAALPMKGSREGVSVIEDLLYQAGQKGKSYVPNAYPDTARLSQTREAVLGQIQKRFGGEGGVLTNEDINRARGNIPGPEDSQYLRDAKLADMRAHMQELNARRRGEIPGGATTRGRASRTSTVDDELNAAFLR